MRGEHAKGTCLVHVLFLFFNTADLTFNSFRLQSAIVIIEQVLLIKTSSAHECPNFFFDIYFAALTTICKELEQHFIQLVQVHEPAVVFS